MIGDQTDFQSRLLAVLPARWFPDTVPILDTLLSGLAATWSTIYGMLQYVRLQARISSASDVWLDLVAWDYFGWQLQRRPSESDDALRDRIMLEMFCERVTRAAVQSAVTRLTGRVPLIFEPAQTCDTGGYATFEGGGGGVGYNTAGGWGSLELPFQCFITAYRPNSGGVGQVAGWGNSSGCYGGGVIEYASFAMVESQITDTDIYAAITSVLPAASVGWTAIID